MSDEAKAQAKGLLHIRPCKVGLWRAPYFFSILLERYKERDNMRPRNQSIWRKLYAVKFAAVLGR